METTTRRKYPRYFDHNPILYAGYSSKSYSKAMMYNRCEDGMYFESDSSLKPDFDLYIKVQRYRPRSIGLKPYKAYRARVKWCHQVMDGNLPCYGIGAQFTAKSHLSYGTNISNANYLCDLCEKRVTDRLIHRTETWLLLCPDCLHYFETLPSVFEEALERFVLGNVL
jgi:hypothetical protein